MDLEQFGWLAAGWLTALCLQHQQVAGLSSVAAADAGLGYVHWLL